MSIDFYAQQLANLLWIQCDYSVIAHLCVLVIIYIDDVVFCYVILMDDITFVTV